MSCVVDEKKKIFDFFKGFFNIHGVMIIITKFHKEQRFL